MKRFSTYLILLLPFLLLSSCYYYRVVGPSNPWSPVNNLEIKGSIYALHSTAQEFYILTREHFYRVNANEELLEKRELVFPNSHYGEDHQISDYSFVRLMDQINGNRQVIELNLVNNPDQVHTLYVDEIPVADGENIDIDIQVALAQTAFNTDGTQLAVVVEYNKAGVGKNLGVVLIDIEYTADKRNYQSITTKPVISIPDLSANQEATSNLRFINGHYYITHQDGAVRIAPQSNGYDIISRNWTLDVFNKDNILYLTHFDNDKFSSSSNNGISFDPIEPSPVKYVEIAGSTYLHQANNGFPFKVVANDLLSVDDIAYNVYVNENSDNGAYRDLIFFNGKYYMSFQDKIYSIEEIETIE